MAPTKTDRDDHQAGEEAPDGGWAWVICFASFVALSILGGLQYSFGLLYVELLDYFQRSKSETSWVLSIYTAIAFVGAPLYSAVANRLGCRLTSILGSLLLAVGFIISTWAPSLYFLFFSIGVLGGAGYGFVYTVCIMAVSLYFDKHRSLATGIGLSGIGFGTFIMGPLLKVWIEKYTWRGAVLLEGAIGLNCLVCSLLYRPLEDVRRSRRKRIDKKGCDIDVSSNGQSILKDKALHRSTEDTAVNIKSDHHGQQKCLEVTVDYKVADEGELGSRETDFFVSDVSTEADIKTGDPERMNNSKSNNLSVGLDDEDCTKDQLLCEDTICGDTEKRKEHDKNPETSWQKRYIELLQNFPFIIIFVSVLLAWIGYSVPFVYIVDTGRMSGIKSWHLPWLISSMGIANTVGRGLYGALGAFRFINRRHLYSGSMIMCGAVAIAIPVSQQFEPMLCFGILFSLIAGGSVTLSLVLLVDTAGLSHCSEAVAFFCVATGIGSLLGPPIAGWLFDISGTYLATFLFCGLTFIVGGLGTMCVSCWNSRPSD